MENNRTNTLNKPYHELISQATPTLNRLLSAGSHPPNKSYAENVEILSAQTLDVVNTVCAIAIIGRQCIYNRRHKPVKNPDKVFKTWAEPVWKSREDEKDGAIAYICGKVYMKEYLERGIRYLQIQLDQS